MRFIDRFSVILLDMMGTFMFGGDRFGEGEDYAGTYRALGGGKLSDAEVRTVVGEVFGRVQAHYEDPARQEDFAPVRAYLEGVLSEFALPAVEAAVLDELFAVHETGLIPVTHARILHGLRETHRLGVVSNIWSPRALFLAEFRRAGVAGLFETIVFSSDHHVNKPSPLIFRRALEQFGLPASEALFVGDDLTRDVAGAKAAGMFTVWVNTVGVELKKEAPHPDLVIKDLGDLLEA